MTKSLFHNLIIFISILVLCLLLYRPALNSDFVNWDDNDYIYENPVLLENDWSQQIDNLIRVFTSVYRSIYTPITTLSFSIEEGIYGFENPGWWHFDNILLHSINVFLVFLIAGRLRIDQKAIWLITLLFAIHPMRVESVAWLTARKDLLYTLFFLLGMLNYLKSKNSEKNKLGPTVFVWVFFILSLLTKVLAVAFPLTLVIIDLYQDRSINKIKLIQKIPYFVLSLIFGLASLYLANNYSDLQMIAEPYNIFERLALASSALGVYFVKVIYPYKMIPLYPFPLEVGLNYYLSILVSLASGLALIWAFIRQRFVLFLGLGIFLVNIVFTLQFIPVGQGWKADRYTYLPYLGLFIPLAVYFVNLIDRTKFRSYLFPIFAMIIFSSYGLITYNQTKIWNNSGSLWSHQLRYTPTNSTANKNMADYYKSKNPQAEFNHLTFAINSDPKDPALAYRMGMLISEQAQFGTLQDAIGWLDKSILLDSTFAGILVNRAVLLGRMAKYDEALRDLDKAESLDPSNSEIYLNRAVILNTLNFIPEALADLEKYLTLNPSDANIWIIQSQIHLKLSQYPEALRSVNEGIRLKPNNGEFYFNRAIILDAMGRTVESQNDVLLSRKLGYQGQKILGDQLMGR